MIQFWIVAALFIAAALAIMLPPLLRKRAPTVAVQRRAMNIELYRDQLAELDADLEEGSLSREQYEASRQELEHRLLEDVDDGTPVTAAPARVSSGGRITAALVTLAVPLLAVGLYLKLGAPEAINPEAAAQAEAGTSPHDSAQQIQAMVGQLSERLEKNPDDAEGWIMLGRSLAFLQRYPDAAKAFEKAVNLGVNDPRLLTDYADILAMTQGRKLDGRPMELIERALQIDPANQKGLALAGTAEYERGNFKGALAYWERLLKTVPEGSDAARSIENSIADARAGMAQGGKAQPAKATTSGDATGGTGRVTGTVTLDSSLASKVSPTDTLFVFARAAQGPKMPLAIQRIQVKDLPYQFTLDDSMAMSPQMKLSNFGDIVVGARVSKSGDAMPKSGDLEGLSSQVKVGSQGLKIVINRAVP